MVKYRHLFFDLDRTIWDFDKNSKAAVEELLLKHKMIRAKGFTADDFFLKYQQVNQNLWRDYRANLINKTQLRKERFNQTFKYFGIEDQSFALAFNNDYVATCSIKTNLIPNSKEALDYLSKSYKLHIITNGFKEAQYVKLEKSDLNKYFEAIVVSDEIGIKKPDPKIFQHAIELSGAALKESIMIGDDYEADVLGAKKVGMDQVFLDHHGLHQSEATHTIASMLELKQIF